MIISLGDTIKRLRREREMTQETLADFLGVSFQAVSKWERGETYPDITALPSIASFFNVSVDTLLGVDSAKQEEKIQEYIDFYYREWQNGDFNKILEAMKTAINEFPGEFRLLSRYMNTLIVLKNTTDSGALSILGEVRELYNTIDSHCTDDSIRIWAKKLICTVYKRLSAVENSGVTIEDMEAILNKMPLMQNSRDYTATYLHPTGDKHDEACKEAICELLYLLNGAVVNGFYYTENTDREKKIAAAKAVLAAYEAFYPDGDYGKNYRHVIYNHGHIADWYFTLGKTEQSLFHLRKSAELAARFDSLPETVTHSSPLLSGFEIEKSKIPTASGPKMRERVKELIGRYSYTESFKSSAEFKEILEILG